MRRGFCPIARRLLAPGLLAYFWHTPKVGKNVLKELRSLRILLYYGGNLFCARGTAGFV